MDEINNKNLPSEFSEVRFGFNFLLSAMSWLHISSWQHSSNESNVDDDDCLACFLGELSHCI